MTDFSDLTFEDNADQRGPVMIVLNCSDSMTAIQDGMAQSPLQELNAALDVLIAEIDRDKLSRRRADISFLPYGTEPAAPHLSLLWTHGRSLFLNSTGWGSLTRRRP